VGAAAVTGGAGAGAGKVQGNGPRGTGQGRADAERALPFRGGRVDRSNRIQEVA